MDRLNAPTFFDQAIPLSGSSALVRDILLVIFGSLILAVSAKLSIPSWPAPFTAQTLAIMILGATYGWRLAGLSMILYWLEGIAGFPVFASGGGAAYFFGAPTAGYLWGFLPAIVFIGAATQWGFAKNPIGMAGVFLIGNIILTAGGLMWGSILFGTPIAEMLPGWVYPYVIGDLTKILIAMLIVPAAYKAVETFRKG